MSILLRPPREKKPGEEEGMNECIGLSLLFLTSVASEDDLPFRHAHPALVQVFLRLPPQNAITLCFD
jgi:hypothetical protein